MKITELANANSEQAFTEIFARSYLALAWGILVLALFVADSTFRVPAYDSEAVLTWSVLFVTVAFVGLGQIPKEKAGAVLVGDLTPRHLQRVSAIAGLAAFAYTCVVGAIATKGHLYPVLFTDVYRSLAHPWLIALVAVGYPLVFELIFRGSLQTDFAKSWGVWGIVATIALNLVVLNPIWPLAILPILFYTYLRSRYHALLPSMIAHTAASIGLYCVVLVTHYLKL